MARAAYQLAMVNPKVRAEVIEVNEFPELADRYNVRAVPLTVIADRVAIPGAVHERVVVEQLLKAVSSPLSEPAEAGGPTSVVTPDEPAHRGSGLIIP